MSSMFYYGVTNPNDELSRGIISKNLSDLQFWRDQSPDDAEDLASVILKINIRTGIPRKFIAASLFTVRFLRRLPSFSALVERLGHLDMARLNTITRIISKIPSHFLTLFDEHLTAYLTPITQDQVLPQPASIAATLRRLRTKLCPEPEKTADPERGKVTYNRTEQNVRLAAWIPEDEAVIIRDAITKLVETRGMTPAEAFTHLITGQVTTTVTLNVYGSSGGPEYLQGGIWLTDEQVEYWKSKVTAHCDMDGIACREVSCYSPPHDMKAYVRGRDKKCRVPGCNVDAVHCQIDHIIPYDQGGPTTPWNLQCLCIFHHNMKTDGRLEAVPLPDGDVLFVLDGLPFRSTPEGPLSRSNRTWGTRFGDYMDRKVAA